MLHFMPRLHLVCLHLSIYLCLCLCHSAVVPRIGLLWHLRNAPEYTRVCELWHILWHFDA